MLEVALQCWTWEAAYKEGGVELRLKLRHRELPVCFGDAALVPIVHSH